MAFMEQKMGKAKGLTARQKQFLELVIQEPYLLDRFYLTGGTALSSWYLHHRESYDLDFFTNILFDYNKISLWLKSNQEIIGYRSIVINEDFGFMTVTMRYPDDKMLKIDFNRYGAVRIKKGKIWRGLEIDDIYDITVNKLSTIASTPRTRDYIDFYYIFQKYKFTLNQLIRDVGIKFSQEIDPLQLTKNFLRVVEFTDYPRMLVPFDHKEMEKFYLDLAKSLKKEIFTK